MLAFATCHNYPEIAKYYVGAGDRVGNQGPYDLYKCIITSNLYKVFKVLHHYGLNINKSMEQHRNITVYYEKKNQD